MGKRFKFECNYYNDDGVKCENQEVAGGYCAFHHPSLVIERAEQKKRKRPFTISHPLSSTYVPPKPERKERSINEIISNPKGKSKGKPLHPAQRSFGDIEWPSTDKEWAEFERQYAIPDAKDSHYEHYTPAPETVLPIGGYQLIDSIDPAFEGEDKKKPSKFHIPHMQYFVLRTSKGYRAVWLSHCGTGRKGKPATGKLFNYHWSKPFKKFSDAKWEFSRGGESFYKIRDRIKNAKDPKWLPPNARKLAVAGAWETLKLTGAPDKLIERLKQWKADGCPGWRTWTGPSASNKTTPTEEQQSSHVQKWMKKFNWKQ